jgi:ferredoxin
VVRSYEYVVVGSGPSAAAAVQEIVSKGKQVLVLDSSAPKEDATLLRKSIAAALNQEIDYSFFDAAYSQLIENEDGSFVKRKFGQDVVRKNHARYRSNSYISNAKGGFSEVWGSVILPATLETSRKYPFVEELNYFQASMLNDLPKYGNSRSLSKFAPSLQIRPFDNLKLSELQHRIPAQDISTFLVFPTILCVSTEGANSCINCNKCLTGCPVDAIWSSSEMINQLENLVDYQQSCIVKSFKEEENNVIVTYLNLKNDIELQVSAKVLMLGAGVFGTAEILLNSQVNQANVYGKDSTVVQAIHLTQPLKKNFKGKTLSEVTIVKNLEGSKYQYCQIYRFNRNTLDALNLKSRFLNNLIKVFSPILERICIISFTYFPHSESGSFQILSTGEVLFQSKSKVLTLKHYFSRIKALASMMLKMKILPWPVFFILKDKGQGMHFSSTFPYSESEVLGNYSNSTGNPCNTKRVFLLDASGLIEPIQGPPTLFVMANARRIAKLALGIYG